MLLSQSLAWLLEDYDCSGIEVHCNKSIAKEIANSFMDEFSELWEKAVENVEEEFGDCDEVDVPVRIKFTDYGFFMHISQLEIPYSYGDFYDVDYGPDAFNKTFNDMTNNYPQIEYNGLIFYPLCDTRCGEIVQHEIYSRKDVEIYDFIGKGLFDLLSDDEEFEENLATELESCEDYKETIKILYAYKDFYDEALLKKAIQIILNVAEENDEDVEGLEEYIEQVKSGDFIEDEEDDDSDNLPDSYMEALNMFMKAEELGAKKLRPREVISSEDTFNLVIAKAEKGDADSKFIAGKYFIADHIEEEMDRAIQWIGEAAEDGIEEAEEYIEEHPELFA